jgi:hypothetical protein
MGQDNKSLELTPEVPFRSGAPIRIDDSGCAVVGPLCQGSCRLYG